MGITFNPFTGRFDMTGSAPADTRKTKAGTVSGASFSGSPKKYTVVFAEPYDADEDYGIALTGTDGRNYTYENKTENGFTINANASTVISGSVDWVTNILGES